MSPKKDKPTKKKGPAKKEKKGQRPGNRGIGPRDVLTPGSYGSEALLSLSPEEVEALTVGLGKDFLDLAARDSSTSPKDEEKRRLYYEWTAIVNAFLKEVFCPEIGDIKSKKIRYSFHPDEKFREKLKNALPKAAEEIDELFSRKDRGEINPYDTKTYGELYDTIKLKITKSKYESKEMRSLITQVEEERKTFTDTLKQEAEVHRLPERQDSFSEQEQAFLDVVWEELQKEGREGIFYAFTKKFLRETAEEGEKPLKKRAEIAVSARPRDFLQFAEAWGIGPDIRRTMREHITKIEEPSFPQRTNQPTHSTALEDPATIRAFEK